MTTIEGKWVERLPNGKLAGVRKRKSQKSGSVDKTDTTKKYVVRPVAPITPSVKLTEGLETFIFTLKPVVSQEVQNSSPAVVQVSPAGFVAESGVQPVKPTCSICGNIRSPSYQLRYSLKPDKMPRISICRNGESKDTSSEDNDSSRDRYNRRHHRDSTQTTNGSGNTREERNGRNGRYHSPRQYGSHRSETRSDSRDDRRPTSTRTHTLRRSRRSRSPELVRMVQHIHLGEAPRSRSRGRSRTPRSPRSRYRYSSRGDEARKVYDDNYGDSGDMPSADESPRKSKVKYDRRYELVMEPVVSILQHRPNLFVEHRSSRNANYQGFSDGYPVVYTVHDGKRPNARGRSFER